MDIIKVAVETTGKSLDERFSDLVSPEPPRRRRRRRHAAGGRQLAQSAGAQGERQGAQGEQRHNVGTQTVEGEGAGNVERGTQTWLK